MNIQRQTRTGGRDATGKRVMGNVALAVNDPGIPAPPGWGWVPLTPVARMESGHTPSRKRPEYWGGEIPWIGIRDEKKAHGRTIIETLEHTNALGIENSSARVLPAGTVCLSRTASVGYVVKMGRDMATSQDSRIGSVLNDSIRILRYIFLADGSAFSCFSSGSVHQTIYYPELKAFHVCIPPLEEQKRIVAVLDQAFAALDRARANAEANLAECRKLFAAAVDAVVRHGSGGASKTHRLGSIVSHLTNGYVGPTRSIYIEAGVPYLLARHVRNNTLTFDGKTYVSSDFNEKNKKSKLRAGDVLLVQSGHIGHCAVVPEDTTDTTAML